MENEETKKTVVEHFLKDCGITIDKLKYKIANLSIDMLGTMNPEYNLLLVVVRSHTLIWGYNKRGRYVDSNHNRFRFEFTMYFYRDLPCGYVVSQDDKGYAYYDEGNGYAIYDSGKVVERISLKDLEKHFVDDLERGYGKFNLEFEDFIRHLYLWIVEPTEVK